MEKIKKRLKKLREAKNLSVIALSKEIDIPVSTLICWEKGKTKIRKLQRLIILAKYFKVTTDYLLGLED